MIQSTRRSAEDDLNQAVHRLRGNVQASLETEIARRRLKQPDPIQVGWSLTERQVQSRKAAREAADLPQSGNLADIPALLRELPDHQLVVLGPPGAGKSVLSLLLAWDFLQSTRPSDPVPVLLPLSSWRPTIRLLTWITRRITTFCPDLADEREFGKDVTKRLISERRIMLILDGLDELPEALHALAVEAIDAAIAEGLWLLVTCRASEYESITRTGTHLTRAIAVELEAVTPDQAITYLRDSTVTRDSRWGPVHDHLEKNPDSALTKALSSPLMLYLALTVCRRIENDPRDLLKPDRFPTPAAIESHLLDSYLHTVYAEPTISKRQVDSARRYLTTIAQQMWRDGTFDFAWWQINARVTGPLAGTAFGLVWGWLFFALYGPLVGISCGLAAGTAGWLAHTAVREELRQVHIAEDAHHDPKSTLPQYAGIGLLAGLISAGGTTTAVGLLLIGMLDAGSAQAWRHGLLAGGSAGLATLLGSTWGSYQVSRTWFSLTRRLPWPLLKFLDNARSLGVLRQNGAVYQFNHARIQTQLTDEHHRTPRSVRRPWTSGSHWKILLPLAPSGAQIGLAMFGLLLVNGFFTQINQVPLSYSSWAEPELYIISPCDANTPAACTPSFRLQWELPQSSRWKTALTVGNKEKLAIVDLDGSASANGCPGSSVEVRLALGKLALARFVVKNDTPGPESVAGKVSLPRAINLNDRQVEITLRRLDDKTCDLSFSWVNARVVKDRLSPAARQRLGIAEPSDT
ncbi:NACHT domain-containing protein [Streptomyces solicathayae]|uniref:NACHT domain-containing protein n=1 Tax=Streptomyces solicathayae TaxID=3081768 RepID=A0ABZ0M6E7_9ACTN|nr:NACHT domain-containing protein [Streptomyces sp. HUAS YS2]WOX26653.1 NACHT domain-containing protein [Streptomyces sp. HUAS YS2]